MLLRLSDGVRQQLGTFLEVTHARRAALRLVAHSGELFLEFLPLQQHVSDLLSHGDDFAPLCELLLEQLVLGCGALEAHALFAFELVFFLLCA